MLDVASVPPALISSELTLYPQQDDLVSSYNWGVARKATARHTKDPKCQARLHGGLAHTKQPSSQSQPEGDLAD